MRFELTPEVHGRNLVSARLYADGVAAGVLTMTVTAYNALVDVFLCAGMDGAWTEHEIIAPSVEVPGL